MRTRKIIIWTIVILFLISSGLTFVLYLVAPSVAQPDDGVASSPLEEYVELEEHVEVVNSTDEEINVDVPQDNDLQVVINEDEDFNEMDTPIDVVLSDGRIDTPTVGDFSDSLQLSQ
ncbi:MAG: hypothetical protein LBG52_07640 [Candidatus Peribacteria bacterium]|nr:hypothetical protein [Candidatus Peribacteria bacterium]